MFRKLGIVSLAVVAGFMLLKSSSVGSYANTAFNQIRGQVKGQVPVEFEIARLRNEIAQLVPDMKKNLSVIAQEMVDVENLRKDVDRNRSKLHDLKASIQTMNSDLKAGTQTVSYNGVSYSSERVRQKLERDFASYKRLEGEIKAQEQTLDAKERSLDAAQEQMTTIRAQKEELELQVAQLEADLKTLRLAESRSTVQFDDSRLARCKQIAAEIKNRLDKDNKVLVLQGQFATDPIPVEKTKNTKDLTGDVDAYFGANTASK